MIPAKALADAILAKNLSKVKSLLDQGASLYQPDPYGFSPLVEAAIADSLEIARFILETTAARGLEDQCSVALGWALDNENKALAELLLNFGANPNYYSPEGKPLLSVPLLKEQQPLIDLLISKGASLEFARDYIHAKLIGHRFELQGRAEIVDPTNTYIVVGYEGFFPEVTLHIIRQSLHAFINHYEAREHQAYKPQFAAIERCLKFAAELRKLKHYNAKTPLQRQQALKLASQDFWILPVTFKGHAITLVRMGELFSICDRRQDTPVEGKVIVYKLRRPEALTATFLQRLLYHSMDFKFFDRDLPETLALVPKLAFPTHSQLAGNCSWANVEAAVLVALYALLQAQFPTTEEAVVKEKAVKLFTAWQEWDKDHALYDCLYDFERLSPARKASRVSMLGAIFFQRLDPHKKLDLERAKKMVPYFKLKEFRFVLESYMKVYANTTTRKQFPNFSALLKECGFS